LPLTVIRKTGRLEFAAQSDADSAIGVQNGSYQAPSRIGLGLARHSEYCASEMKRMLHPGALLVRISGLDIPDVCRKLVIVDGAVASGATILSIIQLAPRALEEIWVFSAHAADSLVACPRTIQCWIGSVSASCGGQASGVLNESYYAVESATSAKRNWGHRRPSALQASGYVSRLVRPSRSGGLNLSIQLLPAGE
jgi:hypothetical protein